jgi:hypothetical protein
MTTSPLPPPWEIRLPDGRTVVVHAVDRTNALAIAARRLNLGYLPRDARVRCLCRHQDELHRRGRHG